MNLISIKKQYLIVKKYIVDCRINFLFFIYYKILHSFIVNRIRKKNNISVAFIVTCISTWRTEELYLAMSKHKKFSPYIVITNNYEEDNIKDVEEYVKNKGYKYCIIETNEKTFSKLGHDIVFIPKPYNLWSKYFQPYSNFTSLYCYSNYGFHTIDEEWIYKLRIYKYFWQVYFENEICINCAKKYLVNKSAIRLTGLPFMDKFLSQDYIDPWRNDNKELKKIIWAPHHTIFDNDLLSYSTFLRYSNIMIDLAKKYKDYVYFAFKPHPQLRNKLIKLWGEEKTKNYYNMWSNMPNSQFIPGDYIGLFMFSDAMIHDCSSFIIEYQYTNKPILFLENGVNHKEGMNDFAKMAYDLHYKAFNEEEIEGFILNVINNIDVNREERMNFKNKYLVPPYSKTACDNIIDNILY